MFEWAGAIAFLNFVFSFISSNYYNDILGISLFFEYSSFDYVYNSYIVLLKIAGIIYDVFFKYDCFKSLIQHKPYSQAILIFGAMLFLQMFVIVTTYIRMRCFETTGKLLSFWFFRINSKVININHQLEILYYSYIITILTAIFATFYFGFYLPYKVTKYSNTIARGLTPIFASPEIYNIMNSLSTLKVQKESGFHITIYCFLYLSIIMIVTLFTYNYIYKGMDVHQLNNYSRNHTLVHSIIKFSSKTDIIGFLLVGAFIVQYYCISITYSSSYRIVDEKFVSIGEPDKYGIEQRMLILKNVDGDNQYVYYCNSQNVYLHKSRIETQDVVMGYETIYQCIERY